MNTIQSEAFRAAERMLDRNSKFYNQDLADLRKHYSERTAKECEESLDRFYSPAPTEEEIAMHCQFD